MKAPQLIPVVTLLALIALVIGSFAIAAAAGPESAREIVVDARQFFYEPAVIRVAQGDHVKITLRAMDLTHGLMLDDYGVEAKAVPGKPAQLEFVADRVGQFHFRCTQTCGAMHPFMIGKLIVEPNLPFNTSLGLAGLLTLGALGLLWYRREPVLPPVAGGAVGLSSIARQSTATQNAGPIRLDFLSLPVIGRFLRWRGFQFAIMLPLLVFLMLALVAALRGTPVGSHNLGIVAVWVFWWPLLIMLLIPIGGRAWCAACPAPGPGEWLQRLSFIRKREGALFSLARRWPAKLRNMWLQNGAFLLIALFSAVVLTTPLATAAVLGGFFLLAIVMSLVFEGRTFCRYVCPLGGFIGLCSLAAPLAVRVKDAAVCRAHSGKECIKGSAAGYGCPWFEYPGTMDSNAYCGLCMECVKTCPKGNIAVGLQPIGRDLAVTKGRLDEAFRTFIALGSAALYSAVMLGPWGALKSLAGKPLDPGFAAYAALLLGTTMVVVPGLFLATAWLSHRAAGDPAIAPRRLWQNLSYGLVPMALTTWIAFSLSLVLVSGYHVIPVLSDPLGHGWNLFGTAAFEGGPVLMGLLPYLQVVVLLFGLVWSIRVSWQIARRIFARRDEALRAVTPVAVFLFGTTATFLWLFLG